jgi:epoxide hydrolase-like predicted phosphatase
MTIHAVVFDIGGVLEFTPATGWQQRWASALDTDLAEFEARLAAIWRLGSVGAATLEEIERRTSEALSLDRAQTLGLLDDAWTEYLGSLNQQLATYFAGLRPRYRTGILSNSFVGARDLEQAAYGFQDMCDVVVYSHEEGVMKPEPRFYRLVCERLGVAPADTVFLDDVQTCVDGALAVGMKAVRFVDTDQAIAEINRLLA